eukprot:COSAG01_NODE_3812_length_5675_cov_2.804878_5_plen_74_part_00
MKTRRVAVGQIEKLKDLVKNPKAVLAKKLLWSLVKQPPIRQELDPVLEGLGLDFDDLEIVMFDAMEKVRPMRH